MKNTKPLHLNQINWSEINRRSKLAFKTSFIFLLILVVAKIFMESFSSGGVGDDLAENIYIYI